MKRHHALLLFAASCSLALSTTSEARSHSSRTQWTQRQPLANFMTRNEPLVLRNSWSEYTLHLPISPRIKVERASLHLELTNSIALLEGRSQLTVKFHSRIVAQIPLRPHQPSVSADIDLPVELFEVGYDALSFSVAQHYTLECEDPSAPELWTQIDSQRSEIRLVSQLRPLNPRLSELDGLIDRRLWKRYELGILFAGETSRDAQLIWGALVAQGAGLRLEYLPLDLRVGNALGETRQGKTRLQESKLHERDQVLIGTRNELIGLLDEKELARISGAHLAIRPLRENPSHFLLLVTGTTEDEVTLAARAFAHLNTPFPDTNRLDVDALELPRFNAYTARHAIHEDTSYTFGQLGFETITLGGLNAGRASLRVWVPPDLFSAKESDIEFRLHMAHGAAMRDDSVLNLFLNGTFENVIHLKDAAGAVYRDYKIALPLRSLRPGPNEISFEPRMMPLVTGECQAIQYENLLLTIFDDSELEIPRADHQVLLPNLALMAQTGFPYTTWPDGSRLAVQVVGSSTPAIEASFMIAARLAQHLGYPFHSAEFSFSEPDPERELIVIGPESALPDDLRNASPLGLGEVQSGSYPTITTLQGAARSRGPLTIIRGWFGSSPSRPARPDPENATITQRGSLGRYCAAVQFESPRKARRTITLITAASPERLRAGVERLVDPGSWGALSGNIAIWLPEEKQLHCQRAGHEYAVGDASSQTRLAFAFTHQPLLMAGLLALLLVGLSLTGRILLVRYRRRHHPGVGDAI